MFLGSPTERLPHQDYIPKCMEENAYKGLNTLLHIAIDTESVNDRTPLSRTLSIQICAHMKSLISASFSEEAFHILKETENLALYLDTEGRDVDLLYELGIYMGLEPGFIRDKDILEPLNSLELQDSINELINKYADELPDSISDDKKYDAIMARVSTKKNIEYLKQKFNLPCDIEICYPRSKTRRGKKTVYWGKDPKAIRVKPVLPSLTIYVKAHWIHAEVSRLGTSASNRLKRLSVVSRRGITVDKKKINIGSKTTQNFHKKEEVGNPEVVKGDGSIYYPNVQLTGDHFGFIKVGSQYIAVKWQWLDTMFPISLSNNSLANHCIVKGITQGKFDFTKPIAKFCVEQFIKNPEYLTKQKHIEFPESMLCNPVKVIKQEMAALKHMKPVDDLPDNVYNEIHQQYLENLGIKLSKEDAVSVFNNIFIIYGCMDAGATIKLFLKDKEQLMGVCKSTSTTPPGQTMADYDSGAIELAPTLGSNVAAVVFSNMVDHFTRVERESLGLPVESMIEKYEGGDIKSYKMYEQSQVALKAAKKAAAKARTQNLVELPSNKLGMQALVTSGGMLFSRTPYCGVVGDKTLKRILADVDIKSCYSTPLSKMNIYLGQPIVRSYDSTFGCMTVRQLLDCHNYDYSRDPMSQNSMSVQEDGFIWTVNSVKAIKSTTTGLDAEGVRKHSDIGITSLSSKVDIIFEHVAALTKDKSPEGKVLNTQYVNTQSETGCENLSTGSEARGAVMSLSTLQTIYLYGEEMFNHFLDNTYVIHQSYYDKKYACKTPEEYLDKTANQTENISYSTQRDTSGEAYDITREGSNSENYYLVYPIKEFVEIIKNKRNKLKAEKDPLQETLKNFNNTIYGIHASYFIKINNHVASNYITTTCRALAWMMITSLNGVQVITDGTTLSMNDIPIGKTFKQLRAEDKYYEIIFSDTFYRELSGDPEKIALDFFAEDKATGFSKFKQHMADFFELPIDHPIIQFASYELKDEKYTLGDKILCKDNKSGELVKIDQEVFKAAPKGAYSTLFTFNKLYNKSSGDYFKCWEIDDEEWNGKEALRSYKNKDVEVPYIKRMLSGAKYKPMMSVQKKLTKDKVAQKQVIKMFEKMPYKKEVAREMAETGGNMQVSTLLNGKYAPITVNSYVGGEELQYRLVKLIGKRQFRVFSVKQNHRLTKLYEELDRKFQDFYRNKLSKDIEGYAEAYNITLNPKVDYETIISKGWFTTSSPGLEILTINNSQTVDDVRAKIQDYILQGKFDIWGDFNLKRKVDEVLESGIFDEVCISIIFNKINHYVELYEYCTESPEVGRLTYCEDDIYQKKSLDVDQYYSLKDLGMAATDEELDIKEVMDSDEFLNAFDDEFDD
jgi:hypothetical protein